MAANRFFVFPQDVVSGPNKFQRVGGLTKLEWMTGEALRSGLLPIRPYQNGDPDVCAEIGEQAVDLAEAVLAVLEKRQRQE